MTEVTALGLERFHFWGHYSVDIVLRFADEDAATRALPVLNQVRHPSTRVDACGIARVPGAWQHGKENRNVLLAWIAEPDIDAVHKQLEQYGADPDKISSMSKSIDHGQPFEIRVPVPEQYDGEELKLDA